MAKKLQQENTELKDAIAKLTSENLCLKSKLEVLLEHSHDPGKKQTLGKLNSRACETQSNRILIRRRKNRR